MAPPKFVFGQKLPDKANVSTRALTTNLLQFKIILSSCLSLAAGTVRCNSTVFSFETGNHLKSRNRLIQVLSSTEFTVC